MNNQRQTKPNPKQQQQSNQQPTRQNPNPSRQSKLNDQNSQTNQNKPSQIKLISKAHLQVAIEKQEPIEPSVKAKPVESVPVQPTQKPVEYKATKVCKLAAFSDVLANRIKEKPILAKTNGSSNVVPSVPVLSTSELAPAPSVLPIPFGLSPINQTNENIISNFRRNVLLDNLCATQQTNFQSTPASNEKLILNPQQLNNSTNPLSNLLNEIKKPVMPTLLQMEHINKINKLRDLIKEEKINEKLKNNFDLIEYMNNLCLRNDVNIEYKQHMDNDLYVGQLYLQSFRLVSDKHKKRNKCAYYTYKNAFLILASDSPLVVRQVTNPCASEPTGHVEYELYRIDSDVEMSAENTNSSDKKIPLTSITNQNGHQPSQSGELVFKKSIFNELFNPIKPQTASLPDQSIADLNNMLKSMILPKESTNESKKPEVSGDIKESSGNNNEDDEDDDEKSSSSGLTKKLK